MKFGFDVARALFAGLALTVIVGAAPVVAQPAGGQPSGSNPTAMSVKEDQLLRELNKLQGRVSIPDGKASLLEQPQGRDYRGFREGALPWIGGIAVLGMILALAVFYFRKGTIAMEHGPESGRKILRFNAFERFTHWMTATCFIVLAISGLNYIFGKRLLMPLIGPDAFAGLSQWAKYAHNYLSWPFMLGVVFMIAVWVKDNIPDRYDAAWLRARGGFFGGPHPVAGRFNAGQKLIFWSVVLLGIAISVSGYLLMFPFYLTGIAGMQTAQIVHAVIGLLFIAIILGHIYIGTIGMQGAFPAMGNGEVDLNWAREHHALWVEEEERKLRAGKRNAIHEPAGTALPAE
jgi:formate dehydrogenase subunit gamma